MDGRRIDKDCTRMVVMTIIIILKDSSVFVKCIEQMVESIMHRHRCYTSREGIDDAELTD